VSLWLPGTGVSRGIAIGPVHRLLGDEPIAQYAPVDASEIEGEVVRFFGALQRAKEQLLSVRNGLPPNTPEDIGAFIDTHLLMIEDRSISEATAQHIRAQACNAEYALTLARDALLDVFDRIEDPYLRTRRDDVQHVCNRILRILMRQDRALDMPLRPAGDPGISVIVADDITPADLVLLSRQHGVAIVTEYGGPLSHAAILARSLRIPAVVGVHNARRLLRDGETVIVDGDAGHILAAPDRQALAHYRAQQQQQDENRQRLTRLRGVPAVSTDGVSIRLLVNVDQPQDARLAMELGAEGVGLHRTEFLYMNRPQPPDEDEQVEAYARLLQAVDGPVTIRTLDLGADKQVDSGRSLGPTPNNPALGLRAIRLCLRERALFRAQLRALLRASALGGQLRIMIPMLSSLAELRQVRQELDRCREELRSEGHSVPDDVPLGAMIEIPAAAIAAPLLARHCAFFSIGTNDLIQYTLAIDRVDDEVNYLYDPTHPAVLQLIEKTIAAGNGSGIPVSMCGEMAGDIRYTRLLLGLGLTEFSMHPASLLEVKSVIRDSNVANLRAQTQRLISALASGDADSAAAALDPIIR